MRRRVYIGRLPADVTKDELLERFERLVPPGVALEDVQLMANSAASDFAYLTVRSIAGDEDLEEKTVDALVKAYHNTKWKGKRLRVEIAKPDYLERLRLLWEEDAKRKEDTISVRNELLNSTTCENPVLELKKTKRYRGKRVVFDENGGVGIVEKEDDADMSSETSDEESAESEEDVGSVPMSSEEQEMDVDSDVEEEKSLENDVVMDDNGDLSSETSEEELQEQENVIQDDELSSETSEEEDVQVDDAMSSETSEEELSDAESQEAASESSDVEEELDIEAEIQKELNANYADEVVDIEAEIQKELKAKPAPVLDDAARKEAANARRLAAIQEREALAKAAKSHTPAPISNKKITFDSDDDEEEDTAFQSVVLPKSDSKKRSFLSDSEDDEEDDDFLGLNSKRQKTEALFEFRPEFAGVEGKKLFEMQKRFGGDQRFRLDARFVEGDEFNDGVDTTEASEEPVDDTIQEWRVEAADAEETAKQQYMEETTRALDVLEQIFPTMELAKAKARLHRSLEPEHDLKQLGWLGAVRRYDPRDATSKSMEQTVQEMEKKPTVNSDGEEEEEESQPRAARKETPMPETSGERYFAATSDLSTMFTRVRANSEDGEAMEAAFDGIVRPAQTESTGGFSFASMFNLKDDVIEAAEEETLEKKDEENVQEQENEDKTWQFANTVRKVVQDDSTDDEAMDEQDEAAVEETKAEVVPKRKVSEVLAFGQTFLKPDPWTKTHEAEWMSLRKTFTLDFRRKHKQALKNKKAMKKQLYKSK